MRQAKAGISGLSPTEKVAKALLLVTKMTGNINFTTPTPTLVQVDDAREKLDLAIMEAASGDHAKVQARVLAEAELDDIIVRLSQYVNTVANGDVMKILSSGFELRKPSEPIGPLPAPTGLEARTGAQPGEVDLRWDPVEGAYMYLVFVNTTDPDVEAEWKQLDHSAQASYDATGLEPAKHIWFRVNALGAFKGASPFSDPAKGFSAPLP
jgi:hypothetical protein